jgi:hypothetical protein
VAPPKGAAPSAQDAMDRYGYIAQLANQVPELRNILNRAIDGGWPVQNFTSAVQDSRWWKTHSDTVRQRLVQQATDPGSFAQDRAEALRRVDQMASRVGLTMAAGNRDFAAHQLLMGGWNDLDLHNYVGSWGRVGKTYGGEFAQSVTKLQEVMSEYGVANSRARAEFYAKRLVSGAKTIDGYTMQFRKEAESRYPALKALLDEGQTVRQIAQPYIDDYARILELDPAGLNLSTPQVQRALSVRGVDGKPSLMPLWQWQHELRHDPRYDRTTQAKTDAYSLLHQIGKDWGFAS